MTKEETDVEENVKILCESRGVEFHTVWGSTLVHKDDLPFSCQNVSSWVVSWLIG